MTDVGTPETDDAFLIIINASSEPIDFILPAFKNCREWQLLIDTSIEDGFCESCGEEPGKPHPVPSNGFLLFVRVETPTGSDSRTAA